VVERGPRYWLQSPAWDGFWLLSGLWLVAIMVAARILAWLPDAEALLALSASLLLWGGHILSPVLTAWSDASLRARMWLEPRRFILAPLAVLIGSIVLGIIGSRQAVPPPLLQWVVTPRLLLFFTFNVWNTWHFAAQHFGVLTIYRRQAGLSSERDRQADRMFTIGIGCVLLPLAWFAHGFIDTLGPLLDWMSIPASNQSLAVATATTAAVWTTGRIARELSRDSKSIPRALYMASIGIQPTAAVIAGGLYHFAAFTACHWLIAIALSARITSNRLADAEHRSMPARAASSYAGQVAVLVALSIPVYWVLRRPSAYDPLLGAVQFGYSGEETTLIIGALSGAYFGISFVHFLYDRYVYSFRHPEIRSAVGSYLLSPPRTSPAGAQIT
jgi:hypothetical protein